MKYVCMYLCMYPSPLPLLSIPIPIPLEERRRRRRICWGERLNEALLGRFGSHLDFWEIVSALRQYRLPEAAAAAAATRLPSGFLRPSFRRHLRSKIALRFSQAVGTERHQTLYRRTSVACD
ncbi:hypothetical protein AA313_de0207038 [Arthrobotrys entomopaga]|nr:hypothetical protein AA313_de0207038 [Arthrobotrys entomopaga]